MKLFQTLSKKTPAAKLPKFMEMESFGSGNTVFQIDFLRRRFLPRQIRFLLVWIVVGWLALQTVIFGVLALQCLYGHARNFQLKSRIEKNLGTLNRAQLVPAMDTLHKAVMYRLMDLQTQVRLQNERFLFAGKLAGLTRTLPARTWIREIVSDRAQRTLTIHGSFLIDPRNPYEIPISSWIEALKKDPQFSAGLVKIDMTEASSSTREKADIYLFQILCQWDPQVKI
jgi:hypothetical protein